MSLVVAQVTTDGPRIVSDTRVSYQDGTRPAFKTGTLKAVIVSRDAAICFAGDVAAGLRGIRDFARDLQRKHPMEELLPPLQRFSEDQGTVEFIVANGEGDAQLMRIRSGELEEGLKSAWIGDQEAFERFQQARSAGLGPLADILPDDLTAGARTMLALSSAMQVVIDDPTIQSVDDFSVRVAYGHEGFEYLGSVFIYVGRDFPISPGDDLISKMAQPVSEGGYAESVVEPAEAGMPALGLSFPRARLGMLFLPLQFDGAEVIQDVSPNEYASVVLERYGVAMKDPGLRHGEERSSGDTGEARP